MKNIKLKRTEKLRVKTRLGEIIIEVGLHTMKNERVLSITPRPYKGVKVYDMLQSQLVEIKEEQDNERTT